MKKTHLITILLGAVSLTGCETLDMGPKAPDIRLDDEDTAFIEAV